MNGSLTVESAPLLAQLSHGRTTGRIPDRLAGILDGSAHNQHSYERPARNVPSAGSQERHV